MEVEYNVSKQIDYISVSTDKLPLGMIGDLVEEIGSARNRNYNKTYKFETGAISLVHTENPNMRVHTILSGETLGVIRGEGYTDRDIVEIITGIPQSKITRVDVCVTSQRKDDKVHELTPHAIANIASTNRLVSRLKPDNGVISPDMIVETAYIGSRKARNRLFRAYDKGLELDLEPMRVIRYELETRKRANVVMNALNEGIDIGSIIKKYVDFPNVPVWNKIMNAPSVPMPHVENNITAQEKRSIEKANRWHWLLTSVAPALARALVEDYMDADDGADMMSSENMRLFSVHTYNKIEEIMNGIIDEK